ncbi:hypothetical protein IQK56_03470 [Pseudomonas sp. MAFF 301449]|uniref:Uncharacterized protein n=1 Tax=Pseudomonas cyclaminis TaxID=2781239 RepID=A0ABR9SMC7_9PSED|nr:hypothetical protein [Pseudomonas cyclaminis]MBE8590058.1 hypothetical protein [Pseudomonas cyclaminis]MBE8600647.1 hypothetical protein [Pseudomonas cyclaminis]
MRGLFFACFNSVKPFVHQALNALAHLLIKNKCINALTVYAYMHILQFKPANKVVEAARMLPWKTGKARNIGKDAIEAMARTPGNNGKDADAL